MYPQYGPPGAGRPPAGQQPPGGPGYPLPPVAPAGYPPPGYPPAPAGVTDPVQAALKRPWQVGFFGWLQVIASVAGVACTAVLALLLIADGSGTYLSWWHWLILSVEAAFLLINLFIAIAYLRGSRGAYLYYSVVLWLALAFDVLVLVGLVVLFFVVQGAVYA
ncbi:MAG: hypothetical protein QM662_06640 [Gordonia sp. (in: high G+C Gram-positive bacteria)]